MRIYVKLDQIEWDDFFISAISLTPFDKNCYYLELEKGKVLDRLELYNNVHSTDFIPYNCLAPVGTDEDDTWIMKTFKEGKLVK